MTLRIVHVVRQYAPAVGGLETVVARLAGLQRKRSGHDATVVTLDRVFRSTAGRLAKDEVVDDVPVKRLEWFGSSRYPIAPGVLGAIHDADLVHVHGIDFFFDWLAATRWLHGRKLVATTHGGFFHTSYASRLKKLWFQTITRASSTAYRAIVATSDHDGAVFGRIAGERVTVIENGADVDRHRDVAAASPSRTLLYFGRWSSNKGLEALLGLFAALRQADQGWSMIVAGRPYDLTKSDLVRVATEHGVRDAVEFHESPDDAALGRLMARSTYFACLSRHEGFGIAAIEAMSAGLVPLLSDIPPFRKIVDGARCGLILEATNTTTALQDQAQRIEQLHRHLLANGNRQRAAALAFATSYGWQPVVDRYESVYRDVLAPRQASIGTPVRR